MTLSKEQIKHLKKHTHALKPSIWIGQHGLSDAVLKEIDNALAYHELVKCKIAVDDKDARQQLIKQIEQKVTCQNIQSVGKTAVFYRLNPKQNKLSL